MEFQRNKITDALTDADPEDIIMYSDSDEIPNLEKINFKDLKEKVIIFKQKMFYYKFNLVLKNFNWYGTRAFKKKNLTTFQWMRHVKPKRYNWWRIDLLWKKDKYKNVRIVENGGWHFTQLKSPKDLYYKFLNDEHHDEFELSKITFSKVKDMINKKYTIYSHFIDKLNWKDRWNNRIKLSKVSNKEMPFFLKQNLNKYKKWLA
jgi:beta-1,4-mannosyl-glycoprotein beta-1,4-N-acetylglucosaminyltransferase